MVKVARGALVPLRAGHDFVAPGKPPSRAPPVQRTFWIAQFSAGFDRRGGGVDVAAIQAQAGFQPQRVARAQADRLDLGLGQQQPRQRLGVLTLLDRDFEAVFAGVAATGDEGLAAASCTGRRS